MSLPGRPDAHPSLAQTRSGRRRGRRFLGAFSGVVTAHVLLAALLLGPLRPVVAVADLAPVTVELAPASFLTTAPASGAAQPAATSQAPLPSDPQPHPPLRPDPAPPKPEFDPKALADQLPPVDFTAQPIALTPPTPSPQPSPPSFASSPMAAAIPCDLTGAIQAALEGDPRTRDELALIPQQARSVANAVQLWDGAWVDPDRLGGPTIAEPIREAIVNVIRQAPPVCHDQTVAGPRLFAITDPRGTIIVALGSGQWRWSDLLAPRTASAAFLDALFNP